MRVIGFLNAAILAEIINADYFVACFQQVGDQISSDKAGGSGNQNFRRFVHATVAGVTGGNSILGVFVEVQKFQISITAFSRGMSRSRYTV